jgi:hypothetical protein
MDLAANASSYLRYCLLASPQDNFGSVRVPSDLLLGQRDYITGNLVPEIIGFVIYTILFGEHATPQLHSSFTHWIPQSLR